MEKILVGKIAQIDQKGRQRRMKNDSKILSGKTAFRGFEISSQAFKMTAKMYLGIIVVLAFAQAAVAYLLGRLFLGSQDMDFFAKYYFAKFANLFFCNPSVTVFGNSVSARELTNLPSAAQAVSVAQGKMFLAFLLSCGVYALIPIAVRWFQVRGVKATKSEHIRGMELIGEKMLADLVANESALLPFGTVNLPIKYEPEHIFIAGKTRVGKSVTLTHQLDAILAKGHRAVIHDFKGEYVERFFRPGIDLILNPLDMRGLQWSLFNDVSTKADISAITGSLIPPSSGDDRFWSAAAQDVIRGVMAACWASGNRTNADIWRAITSPIADIASLCQSVPEGAAGFTYIQDASSKQAASVIAVVMSYFSWLEFAGDGDFSIQRWLEKGTGVIYLTGRPELENTLRPYVSLFIDLLGKKLLSLPDDPARRIYFLLDEFGNLQKLPTFKRLLTAGGSKGGIVMVGIQDFAALQSIYGREGAETIFNSCGSTLVLNVADPGTAQVFSNRFGEYQYWETAETHTMGSADMRDGLTLARQKRNEKLILPSEIQSLPKLVGYLKIPEHNPAKITIQILPVNNLPKINEAFIMRPGLSLSTVATEEEDKENLEESNVIEDLPF
jgi:type IV secretory pathway TraG/TraD family ATPase VirD4